MKKLLLAILIAGVTCNQVSAALPSNESNTIFNKEFLLRATTVTAGYAYTQIPAEYTTLRTIAAVGATFGAVYLQHNYKDFENVITGMKTVVKRCGQAVKNQEGKTGIVLGVGAAYGFYKLSQVTAGYKHQDVIVGSAVLGLVGPWVKEAVIDNYQLGQEIGKVNANYYAKENMQTRYQQVIDHIGTQPQKQTSWFGWACHGGRVGLMPRIFGPSYNRCVDLYNALSAKLRTCVHEA